MKEIAEFNNWISDQLAAKRPLQLSQRDMRALRLEVRLQELADAFDTLGRSARAAAKRIEKANRDIKDD